MLKPLIAAAILIAPVAACAEPAREAAAPAEGYTLEIVGHDRGAVHYVRGEDGRAAAMLTQDRDPDAARLLEGRAAERAFRDAMAEIDLPAGEPRDVQIKLFGQSFAANGDRDGDGHVRMNLNLPDGRQIAINAGDRGDGGDNAHVVIAGWETKDVADYIDDIDSAPAALREEMKDSLGL